MYTFTLSRSTQTLITRVLQYLILSIVVVIIFVPVVILIFGSLKTTGEMYSHPYTVPNPPHWENLTGILTSGDRVPDHIPENSPSLSFSVVNLGEA